MKHTQLFADAKNDVAFKRIFKKENILIIEDFFKSIIYNNVEQFPYPLKISKMEYLEAEQVPINILTSKSYCDLMIEDEKGK